MTSLSKLNFRNSLFLVFCILAITLIIMPLGIAQSDSSKLPQIIDQLITAYNSQDAKSYRQAFSEKLKSEYSLEQIKEILSSNMKGQGRIVSQKTELSPDGKRALVFLKLENSSYDVHIRINNNSAIERLTWFSHKADPSGNVFSGHEQHLVIEKYGPYVEQFVQAIKDTNVEALLALMSKDEDDDWTAEDYFSFLVRMNDRGLKEVGDIEVLASNEVLIPIYFESVDMGFYLEFDKENKISGLRISNYAPNESHGLSYADLGADTLRTFDLKNFDQLRNAFTADSGKVRFIVILSPT